MQRNLPKEHGLQVLHISQWIRSDIYPPNCPPQVPKLFIPKTSPTRGPKRPFIDILHISLRQIRFPGCAIPLLFGRTFFKKSLKIHIPPPPPCPSPQPPPHRPPCRPPRPPPRQPPCRTTCPFVFPSSFPGSTIVLTDEAPRCLAALPHTLMVRDRH